MAEFLKNNPIALRHCVLYEFLRQNPVEESFTAFCETVGDNVVEKEEFQFWFNQFEQRNFDLNLERNEDKKDKNVLKLTDMPIDVMEKIVEELGISDRRALTKTCRSVHQFVEDQKVFVCRLQLSIHKLIVYFAFESLFVMYKECYIKPLLEILPRLKSGYLTTIDIKLEDSRDVMMKEVIEMEQWKQAKEIITSNLDFVDPLRPFYHCKKFDVDIGELSVAHIRQLKEVLFKSPDFEKCSLGFKNVVDKSTIKREFGAPVFKYIYHYPAPSTTEYFDIEVLDRFIYIYREKTY